jgi:hypothetical protein
MVLPGCDEPVRLLGRVTNCSIISVAPQRQYQVGIEYLDMKTRDLQRLKDLIYQIENI